MNARFRAIFSLGLVAVVSGCQTTRVESVNKASIELTPIEGQNPLWQPYVAYLQRAIARVEKQWDQELIGSRLPPPIDAVVTVVFWLSPEGRVARIEEVKSKPQGVGTKACLSAGTRTGTFAPWTEEMRKILSAEEQLTFTFHYEK